MKSRKIKTKVAALGMAVLMGLSSFGSAPYNYATEWDTVQKENPMDAEGPEETEDISETGKRTVTADDITKDIAEEDFAVETCMEGISYDSEKEDVTLIRIEGEDGSTYQAGRTGTFVATYLVMPKDGRDSYVVARKIILTGTKEEEPSEIITGENPDTDAGDDSKENPSAMPEVEINSTNEEDTQETLEKLEEDIESGNVMLFSGAENTFTARLKVNLHKGETIHYPSYIGNYLTCWFTVNGKIAYCLQSNKASPPSGDYVAQVLDSNANLQKVLYYGYGGAGDVTGSYLSGKNSKEKYVYTHIAASYAYAGEAGFKGCDYNDLVNAGVIAYIDYLFGMENPPKGELSLSKTDVEAVRDGDIQKTPSIKLNGDHRNYITIRVPKNVTCHNKTKNTSVTNGSIRVYGGDTFYLTAEMTVIGNYSSGKLYGSVGKTWRTLVVTTGEESQDIGVFESEAAKPVSFQVDWLEMTRIELLKKDADTGNPLKGAVYGVYTDRKCQNLLLKVTATGANGKAFSDYFDAALKTVYVREITAPENYVWSDEIHTVHVEAGKTIAISATDERVTGSIHVNKIDTETQAFQPQGDSALAGAVYGLYAKENILHPDGATGVLYKKDSLIAQGVIRFDGTLDFSELYLGQMYIKEITPPEGYILDTTEYYVTLAYEGQEKSEVTRELTVSEQVKKQAFQLIKITEDGDQTETDLIGGAGFKVYLVNSLSKVKSEQWQPSNGISYTEADFISYDFSEEEVAVTYENGKAIPVPELITDSKGYAVSPELPYGLYVVEESTIPENFKRVHPFLVNVDEDSREPMQWRIFDDRPFEFLLKIVKKDAQTGNTVLKAGASYQIYDCEKEAYVEQIVQYPKKEKVKVFKTNEEGYLVMPEELKASTYRIEEVAAPEGFVRQGCEMSLYEEEELKSALDITNVGEYRENPKPVIEITVMCNTAHQIDPDTGAVIVEVDQYNHEQVGRLTLAKTGEQLADAAAGSFVNRMKTVFTGIGTSITGTENRTGVFHKLIYKEAGVKGAKFELYAKETIYSPDGAKDDKGNPVVRYEKDDLITTLVTDSNGKAVVNNLPFGSYYLKETVAGDHFVLNPEIKEFVLTAENDTQAVVDKGISYKNERQKISVSIEKKDAVSGEALSGVLFGLYTAEDIFTGQGKCLLKKDTLLEKKATDASGKLTFDSDLPHGKYYVKEEAGKTGYLPNKERWEFEVSYNNQKEGVIYLHKEFKNHPTENYFTKVDAATGKELEGARLQIIDSGENVVEEWVSTKEAHIVYGLPEGKYRLHEKLAPLQEGYVSANDIAFEAREDGSVTKVVMQDEYSRVDIVKTDLATGLELKGASLKIQDKDGKVLEEWVTDGKPHRVVKLPVGEELILKEIAAPEGYGIARDVKFILKDTFEVQKVEMKDAKIPVTVHSHWAPKPEGHFLSPSAVKPEGHPVNPSAIKSGNQSVSPSVPRTGDQPLRPAILFGVCFVSGFAFVVVTGYRRKKRGRKKHE